MSLGSERSLTLFTSACATCSSYLTITVVLEVFGASIVVLKLSLTALLVTASVACALAHAEERKPIRVEDSLGILVKSPAYNEFEYNSTKLKRKTRSRSIWMDPDSNYASLFVGQRGIAQLVEWTAPYIQGYTKFDVTTEKTPDYIRAFAKYAARDDLDLFNVNILVPHPRNLGSANLNLIEAFKRARALPENLLKTQNFKVRGVDSQVHSLKDESCLMILDLKKGSVMQISTKQCKTSERLLDFARSLDIVRLNQKLTS